MKLIDSFDVHNKVKLEEICCNDPSGQKLKKTGFDYNNNLIDQKMK